MAKREGGAGVRPSVETEVLIRGMTCMCRERARVWCIERGMLFEHAFVLGWVADGSVSGMVQGVPAEAAEAKTSEAETGDSGLEAPSVPAACPVVSKRRPVAAQMELL